MPLSENELLELETLPFVTGWSASESTLVVKAPTWAMRPNQKPFSIFIPDLQNPDRSVRALRDYACRATAAVRPFFPNVAVIDDHALEGKKSPFKSLDWLYEPWLFKSREDKHPVTGESVTEYISSFFEDWFKPIQEALYYFTGDLSVSKDATGVAMVHKELSGKIRLDFSFGISTKSKMIDYRPIRALAVVLRNLGWTIAKAGFDQFQSHDSVIILEEEEGIPTAVVKYADSFAGCNLLSSMIANRQLIYGTPADDRFMQESRELQVIGERRVDHLKSGGIVNAKDVWDAVTNAVVLCVEDKRTMTDTLVEDDIVEFDRGTLYGKSNEYLLVLGLYTRFNMELDSTVVSIATCAVSTKTGWALVLGVSKATATTESVADMLVKIQSESSGPFLNAGELATVVIDDKPYTKELAKLIQIKGFSVKVAKQTRKAEVSITVLKSMAKERKLRFLRDFKEIIGYRDIVRDLCSYPFISSDYNLQAVSLAVSLAETSTAPQTKQTKAVHGAKTTTDW